jgi:hypothetical protein
MDTRRIIAINIVEGFALGLRLGLSRPWAL